MQRDLLTRYAATETSLWVADQHGKDRWGERRGFSSLEAAIDAIRKLRPLHFKMINRHSISTHFVGQRLIRCRQSPHRNSMWFVSNALTIVRSSDGRKRSALSYRLSARRFLCSVSNIPPLVLI